MRLLADASDSTPREHRPCYVARYVNCHRRKAPSAGQPSDGLQAPGLDQRHALGKDIVSHRRILWRVFDMRFSGALARGPPYKRLPPPRRKRAGGAPRSIREPRVRRSPARSGRYRARVYANRGASNRACTRLPPPASPAPLSQVAPQGEAALCLCCWFSGQDSGRPEPPADQIDRKRSLEDEHRDREDPGR